jgi:hypothetical protein
MPTWKTFAIITLVCFALMNEDAQARHRARRAARANSAPAAANPQSAPSTGLVTAPADRNPIYGYANPYLADYSIGNQYPACFTYAGCAPTVYVDPYLCRPTFSLNALNKPGFRSQYDSGCAPCPFGIGRRLGMPCPGIFHLHVVPVQYCQPASHTAFFAQSSTAAPQPIPPTGPSIDAPPLKDSTTPIAPAPEPDAPTAGT